MPDAYHCMPDAHVSFAASKAFLQALLMRHARGFRVSTRMRCCTPRGRSSHAASCALMAGTGADPAMSTREPCREKCARQTHLAKGHCPALTLPTTQARSYADVGDLGEGLTPTRLKSFQKISCNIHRREEQAAARRQRKHVVAWIIAPAFACYMGHT